MIKSEAANRLKVNGTVVGVKMKPSPMLYLKHVKRTD
jgi:hypothetical protein